MAASVTYTFAPATTIAAAEVNQNFDDIVDYLNDSLVPKDASVAFTSVPSGPSTDPTNANHLARKTYVDNRTLGVLGSAALTTAGPSVGGSVGDLGLSVSFTMPTLATPRAVKFTFDCAVLNFTGTAGDVVHFYLTTGGNTVFGGKSWICSKTFGGEYNLTPSLEVTLFDNSVFSAGAQTVKLRGNTGTGTMNVSGHGGARPSRLVVEGV